MARLVAIGIVLAGAVVGWLYWQQSRDRPFIVSGFIEADQIRVGSRVGGRVASRIVDEGHTVKPGDILFTIDPFDLNEQLAQAQARAAAARAEHDRLTAGFRQEEVEQARAKRDRAIATLEKLVAGPRAREIEIAREQVKIAEANLELAEFEYQRFEQLRQTDRAVETEYNRAVRELKAARGEAAAAREELALLEEGTRKEEIAEAQAALAEAEQALKLMEAGFRVEEIARAAAELAAAEAEVAAIRAHLGELTVASPCDCVVETIELEPGDLASPNAPVVTLLDLTDLWVRAYVPEARLGQVTLGQMVPVTVDSFPEERFAGRITFISREAEFTPRNVQTPEERSKQVFRIKVTLTEGLDRLRVGMAADVHLDEPVQ